MTGERAAWAQRRGSSSGRSRGAARAPPTREGAWGAPAVRPLPGGEGKAARTRAQAPPRPAVQAPAHRPAAGAAVTPPPGGAPRPRAGRRACSPRGARGLCGRRGRGGGGSWSQGTRGARAGGSSALGGGAGGPGGRGPPAGAGQSPGEGGPAGALPCGGNPAPSSPAVQAWLARRGPARLPRLLWSRFSRPRDGASSPPGRRHGPAFVGRGAPQRPACLESRPRARGATAAVATRTTSSVSRLRLHPRRRTTCLRREVAGGSRRGQDPPLLCPAPWLPAGLARGQGTART